MSLRIPTGPPQPQGFNEDPLTKFSKLFVRFLQLVFQTWDAGNYHWDPDDSVSEIIISDQATIQKEVVEKRPAILVARGPAAFTNISLDQFAGPLLSQNNLTPNFNPQTGAKRYTDLLSCTMTYNILSSEGLEAQRIAWISQYATRVLKKSLMRAGLHRVGEELQVGSESAPGSIVQPDSKEVTLVSVTVPFYFQDTWTIEPEDKLLLNKVGIALTSEINAPAPGATIIKDPGINGRLINYSKRQSLDQNILVTTDKTPTHRK